MSTLLIALFTMSAWMQFLMLAAFGVACWALSLALIPFYRITTYEKIGRVVPVATFLSTVATAWALALGFAAADVWANTTLATQAASEERSSISRLAGMARPDALDLPMMREGLINYNNAVRDIEWGQTANTEATPEVDEALQVIRLSIIVASRSGTSEPLLAKMIQDFDELQDARNKRLAIGDSSVSEYKWYLVFFLTFLSMVSIVAVHADRPAAARNALVIFATAATVSLWILILHATPYTGEAAITFEDIRFPVNAFWPAAEGVGNG